MISFKALIDQNPFVEYFPYSELLATIEWYDRRGEILRRDKNCCTKCGSQETITHYDDVTRKKYFLFFGEEERHIEIDGTETFIPKVFAASRSIYLQVHHKYYVRNRLPWKYDDNELTTLCNWCHLELHQTETIDIFTEDMLEKLNCDLCSRCSGAGWFPEYNHVQAGICFECGGSKFQRPPIKNIYMKN